MGARLCEVRQSGRFNVACSAELALCHAGAGNVILKSTCSWCSLLAQACLGVDSVDSGKGVAHYRGGAAGDEASAEGDLVILG